MYMKPKKIIQSPKILYTALNYLDKTPPNLGQRHKILDKHLKMFDNSSNKYKSNI